MVSRHPGSSIDIGARISVPSPASCILGAMLFKRRAYCTEFREEVSEDDAGEEQQWSPRPSPAAGLASSRPCMSPSPGMGRKEEDRVVVGADTLGETQMFSPASMAGHPLAMRMDLSRIQGHYRQLANRQAETSEQSCPESKGSEVSGHMQAKFLKATGRLLRQAQERKGRGRGRGRRGRGLGRGGRRKGERIPAKDLTAALGAQEAASGGAASRGEQVRAPRGTMGTFAGYKRPVGKEAGEEFDMIREAYRTWAEQRKDQNEFPGGTQGEENGQWLPQVHEGQGEG